MEKNIMKKIVKIGFPIVCIAVLGGTFIVLKKAEKKVEEMKKYENTTQNVTSENLLSNNSKTSDNMKSFDVNDNENVQNEISYSIPIENDEDVKNAKKQNQEKAFDIVKKVHGESDDLYYTNEGMEDEKYIVAVRYKETTSTKIYYIVNLEDETAEIYY